ncbi:acyltransferase [Alicyclobacillus fastidiosus]|uniref:Acyltransferase n=1 Tax=Alicyclobacillus fastidiosus TaxID=392011 RepID=A0ABV5AG81_9BACL|nr:acyltransferase [Alicyclobacillus fastidiosus]WEH09778.1 acyltransferase [Alicyclobacillus fastidiosus]
MAKRHLYEIDFMRALIMFAVVCVHVTTVYFTMAAYNTPLFFAFGAAITSLHFTRESFMLITGIVLFVTYYDRPFRLVDFWKKRFLLIGIPYLVWTVAYIVFKGLYYPLEHYWDPADMSKNFIRSMLTGNQYYLYFLFVTIQLYILFPLILVGLRKFKRYHLHIFIGSFVLQLLLMALCKFVIPGIPANGLPPVVEKIVEYREQFILTYQFWYVGGGIIACHYDQIKQYIERHAASVVLALLASVGILWIHFFADIFVLGESEPTAQMVVQPIMIPYSLVISIALLCVGVAWARRRSKPAWQPLTRFIKTASNASFGILLIQPILIVYVERVLQIVTTSGASKWLHYGLWPVSILFVYLAAMVLSHGLSRIPFVSYVVGRKSQLVKPVRQPTASM